MSDVKKVVLVGAGDRADVYASYALEYPDKLKVVGLVDPDETRIKIMKEKYSVPDENCFSYVDEFCKRDKFADAVINGTMDHLHLETSIPVLRKGYDMLLEKPFVVNEDELKELVDVVKETGRLVYICHVLRYAPFYSSIKNIINNGEIGDIISMEHNEHVSYHHMAASYVRGKWRSVKTCFAPMLLAKCCHDIDLMMWMLSDTKPVSVASFGSEMQYGLRNKPEYAGTRCMVDCPNKEECIYSAEHNYVSYLRWGQYVHKQLEGKGEVTPDILSESLKTDNPFGKCIWDFERDGNVDHQSVIVNFANGATGVFNMVGGAARGERSIHIVGTKGEIRGDFEKGFEVLISDPRIEKGYTVKTYDIQALDGTDGMKGAHGGGDSRLVEDFVSALNGGEKTISCTDIMDSTRSHMVVFKAEESRKTGRVVSIDQAF